MTNSTALAFALRGEGIAGRMNEAHSSIYGDIVG
jgi:hypothetical protein